MKSSTQQTWNTQHKQQVYQQKQRLQRHMEQRQQEIKEEESTEEPALLPWWFDDTMDTSGEDNTIWWMYIKFLEYQKRNHDINIYSPKLWVCSSMRCHLI